MANHTRRQIRRRNVNWNDLCDRHVVEPCAHAWVTDESIAHSLEHLQFDDPAVPHHELTHRAHRIASIVLMMEAGVEFNPLRIRQFGRKMLLLDGHHRLRAYQYRKRLEAIPVSIEIPRCSKPRRRCEAIEAARKGDRKP